MSFYQRGEQVDLLGPGVVRIRIDAIQTAELFPIDIEGGAVLVRQGGSPLYRLFFDEPSESTPGAHSIPLVNGEVVVRRFRRLFVKFAAGNPIGVGDGVDGEFQDVVLDVFTTLAHIAVPQPLAAPLRSYRQIALTPDAGISLQVAAAGEYVSFIHSPTAPELPAISGGVRRFNHDSFVDADGFLGANFRCSVAFAARLYAIVNPTGNVCSLLGHVNCDLADPRGFFGGSFHTGIDRQNATVGTAIRVNGSRIAIPRFGYQLAFMNLGAALGTLHFNLWHESA